jgi:hypothetical protein
LQCGKSKFGEENSNYGHKWSDEKKEKQSQIMKQRMNDIECRKKCGDSNRGVKFSKDRILRMHGHRTSSSYSHYPTKERLQEMVEISKRNWTPEYRKKMRKTCEDKGLYIPLEQKEDYALYCQLSHWKENMIKYMDSNKLIEFKQIGFFNPQKNSFGFVRDHKYGRWSGFENKVFPELLYHPVNCEFILQTDNTIKRSKNSQTL